MSLCAVSVQGRGLPAERGELARAGDDGGRLAAPLAEMRPALVQAPLRAPRDLNDARVLTGLAGGEPLTDRGAMAVVVGSLHQQPPCVRRPALVIWPWTRLLSEVCSLGTIPRNSESRLGFEKRSKRPTSAPNPAAESVSIPRKQRNLATVSA